MKRKNYQSPKVEYVVMVTDNIIAASTPEARSTQTTDLGEHTAESSWGNIWNN